MEFGQLHHVEYYVNDLKRSNEFWNWFMPTMGYTKFQEWSGGISWAHKNGTYLVFVQVEEQFFNAKNTRQGNGLNHIAFMGKSRTYLDELQIELERRKIKVLNRRESDLCFEDPNNFAVEVYASEATAEVYEGTIVEESLRDSHWINDRQVIKVEISSEARWHLYSVLLKREEIHEFQSQLQEGPWYAHFWINEKMIVVFRDQIFNLIRADKTTWEPAIEHGKRMGIPAEQLDFLTN